MTEENTQEPTVEDIWDQAAADAEAGEGGDESVVTEAVDEAADKAVDKQPQDAGQTASEVEYTALGRQIREPLDVALKRASMGYDYAQKMEQLKETQSQLEERQRQLADMESRLKETESRWKPIDEYARQNPEWAEKVSASFSEATGLAPTGQPALPPEVVNKISAFEQKLGSVEQFINQQQTAEADRQYWKQVETVQKLYPDIDLQSSDPNTGKTLEYQVLEFAKNNGIQDFDTAFKAFNHDKILESAREKARQEVLAEIKDKRKAGIIGVSSTPTKPATTVDVSRMTDAELEEAALREWESME